MNNTSLLRKGLTASSPNWLLTWGTTIVTFVLIIISLLFKDYTYCGNYNCILFKDNNMDDLYFNLSVGEPVRSKILRNNINFFKEGYFLLIKNITKQDIDANKNILMNLKTNRPNTFLSKKISIVDYIYITNSKEIIAKIKILGVKSAHSNKKTENFRIKPGYIVVRKPFLAKIAENFKK